MNNWGELKNRTNFNTYRFKNKTVIIYDDHRSILNVLYFGVNRGFFSKPPNIITFDFHDDCKQLKGHQLSTIKRLFLQSPDLKEFWSFVEFELSTLDDDWIKAGCECGLIENVINIGADTPMNLDSDEINEYKDHKNKIHDLLVLPHLDDALSYYHGIFDSALGDPRYNRALEILQLDEKKDCTFNEGSIYPFVLDFDMDCFSVQCVNEQIAWPETVFVEKYVRNRKGNPLSPQDFIKKLMQRCEIITICREPTHCGSIGESNKVLRYLDKYIFEGNLNTEPSI
jgi:hypothetical protein